MQNATENKEILEVEVLISENDLQSNPEITELYDAKNQKLRFELSENLTKDFKEKLLSIMPNFKAGDIVQFNPLINSASGCKIPSLSLHPQYWQPIFRRLRRQCSTTNPGQDRIFLAMVEQII